MSLRKLAQTDAGTVGRFIIMGIVNTVVYVGLFIGLRKTGVTPFWANLVAFATAVCVQYIGQSLFTFRTRLKDISQMLRFAVMIGAGLVASSVLATFVGPLLLWPSWLVALVVTVWLPIQNFVLMRLWVYDTDTESTTK